jgi:hypothetical protein
MVNACVNAGSGGTLVDDNDSDTGSAGLAKVRSINN